MAAISDAQRSTINTAYVDSLGAVDRLTHANERHESDQRLGLIGDLQAHQQQLENLGFFDKDDFTDPEIVAIQDAADELGQLIAHIEDMNGLTQMELEGDLANLVQRICVDAFSGILKLAWTREKGKYGLADPMPVDVVDLFHMQILVRVQGRLNQLARRAKAVLSDACLNSDDYSGRMFMAAEVDAVMKAGPEAVAEHARLQQLRQSVREAQQQQRDSQPTMAGLVWDVVGWDSPWDFAKDMVVTAVFSGSKVARWGMRIRKAKDRLARARKVTERLTHLKDKLTQTEKRVQQIRNYVQRLNKLKALRALPNKLMAAFKRLENAQEQVKLLQLVAKEVRLSYIRGVASGAAAGLVHPGSTTSVGAQASNEAARQALINYLDGTAIFKRVNELREIINWKTLLHAQSKTTQDVIIGEYVFLLWLQELLVRLSLTVMRKQAVTAQIVVDEAITASGAVVERALLDLSIIPENIATEAGRTVIATARKIMVKFGQDLAKAVMSN
ncbi:MAG: hypothetical protein V4609_11025 [Pseudomonadota bacterium]